MIIFFATIVSWFREEERGGGGCYRRKCPSHYCAASATKLEVPLTLSEVPIGAFFYGVGSVGTVVDDPQTFGDTADATGRTSTRLPRF